jgi:hypothetical protein
MKSCQFEPFCAIGWCHSCNNSKKKKQKKTIDTNARRPLFTQTREGAGRLRGHLVIVEDQKLFKDQKKKNKPSPQQKKLAML